MKTSSAVRVLSECDHDPLSPDFIQSYKAFEAQTRNQRWESLLDDVRRRAPFRDLPREEQDRALRRLARFGGDSFQQQRSRRRIQHDLPPNACLPGWHQIAGLAQGGFFFGSADTPQIVSADDNNPNDDITGNTAVAVTFPSTGQIALGAAAGGWCDLVFTPSSSLYNMQGNQASASLTWMCHVPQGLRQVAPNALLVSCGVLAANPSFGLIAGDPETEVDSPTIVWLCSQATLDVLAVQHAGPRWQKPVSDSQQLFTFSGFGVEDPNVTNGNGGTWWTDVGSELFGPVTLSFTLTQLPADATTLIVSVSIRVAALASPGIQALALADMTGADTGSPIITAPGYIPPYTNSDADNTASGTQPFQVVNLRVCGI